VWEWCADWYAESYDAQETDNPGGPATGTDHVLRGGGWSDDLAARLRASARYSSTPWHRNSFIGFRCAMTPDP
jgi:formylglycine-generating enzyme required for sulfatase activity